MRIIAKKKNGILSIFQSWKRKNPQKQELKRQKNWNSATPMPDNIYGSKTYGEEWQNFDKFHYGLKYKLMVPFLKFIDWKWGDILSRPIPKGDHNNLLTIFDKCFDESLDDWNRWYLSVQDTWKDKKGNPVPYNKRRASKIYHNQLLSTMKNILKTGYLYDSAYREFANILMIKIYLALRAHYQDKKQISHLFYSSKDTRQASYFKIFTQVTDIVKNVNDDLIIRTKEDYEKEKSAWLAEEQQKWQSEQSCQAKPKPLQCKTDSNKKKKGDQLETSK